VTSTSNRGFIFSVIFGLFRTLVERVPWERDLKGKGVQEGWTFFREEVLKAQELTVPMCCKTNQQGCCLPGH